LTILCQLSGVGLAFEVLLFFTGAEDAVSFLPKFNLGGKSMKINLLLILSALLVSAAVEAGQAPKFGDIVRNSDGSIHYMNQYDASTYCSSQGMHLPSAREFAQLSVSRGAKGIKELNQFPDETSANNAGYEIVLTQNSNGQSDDGFYLNYYGYKKPTGDFRNLFWSSSVLLDISEVAYMFVGWDGDLVYGYGGLNGYRDLKYAVRCVAGP
jgi:hypothetical protein